MGRDGNKYIKFELMEDTGKTQAWTVLNKNYGTDLGLISWYGAWRQYTFHPSRNTEFNNACLITIVNFLNQLNKRKRITEPEYECTMTLGELR